MPTANELPIDSSATAMDMADTMFGEGVSIVSATYTGAATASGIYTNGDTVAPGVTPSDSGVILSTGTAADITNSSGDVNVTDDTTTIHNTAGDADLDAISGMTTFDAAVFEADFVPEGSTLSMQIVFSSEEYLDFVDGGFNDAVGIWVNGIQAELTVGSGEISIDEINDVDNSNLYIDNAATDDTYNTEMDGFTVTLTLKAPVTPGVTNSIKIGIADGGDAEYDSNLLIAADSVQTELIAGDDEIHVRLGEEVNHDLLANDVSTTDSELQITHINGQPVSIGDTITLATGEDLQVTSEGVVLAGAASTVGDNFFTYTVQDEHGHTDVGFVDLITTAPCFTHGTRIKTPHGGVPIEALNVGDLVETQDRGPQVLRWIGRSVRKAIGVNAPVRFSAGAMGNRRETWLSPNHRLLVKNSTAQLMFFEKEVLVRAIDLVDGDKITCVSHGRDVAYYHLLFDHHEIITGDGVQSESYLAGPQTARSFDPSNETSLFNVLPDLQCASVSKMTSARLILKPFESQMIVRTMATGAQPVHDIRP
ncbi:choice-of-anchor L domain-containing protein [uncultured Pelagimonas sp.]|uniref:choice-of-anchor L domain-containing protein n=1 Tax=uncultured Pelagimonas sp. TaxID=1618102 RepID=UPI0026073640|nr:choice-of-anchor L domain-containing protein [uncultured Pelagimonas sp.]